MLTERQYEVVMAIVFEYIHTGDPVGSRALSKKYLTRISAATIRNEMADLEEMGYITQPHTSAGRIPTSRAFRIYVDSILEGKRERRPELADRLLDLKRQRADFEQVLAYSSQLLSRATQTVALAASAPMAQVQLERVEFVSIDLNHALLLVVLQGRLIHQKLLAFPCEMSRETLDEIARRINTVASGRCWNEVRGGLRSFIVKELSEVSESCRIAMSEIDSLLSAENFRFFTTGVHHILGLPDFQDIGRLQAMLCLLEEEDALSRMVRRYSAKDGLNVIIGNEDPDSELGSFSALFTSSTEKGTRTVLGLIGPVRMDYERAIAALETVWDGLSGDGDPDGH
jgi:heat-inducible transcriptional repressor